MGSRRQWTDADKAAALAALDANEGNVSKTARALKVPRSTLQGWSSDRGTNADVPILRQEKKGELADELEALAYKLIDAMPGKIGEASLQQVATSLGITIDKAQLLRGKPTAINEERGDAKERLAHLVHRHATRTDPDEDSGGADG